MTFDETEIVRRAERITRRRLRLWVRRGWVVPQQSSAGPRFDGADLARLSLICELKDEINLSDDAVGVVLSLIDQLHSVRHEFTALGRAVEAQPEDVRRAVHSAYRRLRAG